MDAGRVVDVWGRTPDGKGSFGSGYLIGPGLVLTARHVVAESDGRPFEDLQVRFIDGDAVLACHVEWTAPDGVDVAVMRVADTSATECCPVRLGQLLSVATGIMCEAIGFPKAMQGPDGARDSEHLSGTINAGAGLVTGRMQITATSAAPKDGSWGGISGAAVFCGPLLTGVIIEDPAGYESRRLVAEPVTRWFSDPAFRLLVGDGVVVEAVGFSPGFRAVEAPSAAYLLRADVEAVRFRSRSEEMAQLAVWCEGSGLAVRLLTGPGGQGKTRLARELARRLKRESTWVVTWLGDDGDLPALRGLTRPLLVVADYAETRPERVKQVILAARAEAGKSPIRILLVARSAGDWWTRLREGSSQLEMALDGALVEELAPLEDSLAGREQAFTEAVTDLAAVMDANGWPHTPPQDVAQPDMRAERFGGAGAALTVQMTALAGLLGEQPRTDCQRSRY